MSQEISSSMLHLTSFAARQWRDYQQRTPGSAFADPALSMTLEEAYAVQMETARLRCAAGDAVAGYKVGCIGAGVAEQFGMSGPIHARLFRSEIRRSGEILRYDSFVNPAIEAEMALSIDDDGRIAAAFPIVELHHFVFLAPRKTLAELIANNGINAGIVIPDALKATQKRRPEHRRLPIHPALRVKARRDVGRAKRASSMFMREIPDDDARFPKLNVAVLNRGHKTIRIQRAILRSFVDSELVSRIDPFIFQSKFAATPENLLDVDGISAAPYLQRLDKPQRRSARVVRRAVDATVNFRPEVCPQALLADESLETRPAVRPHSPSVLPPPRH